MVITAKNLDLRRKMMNKNLDLCKNSVVENLDLCYDIDIQIDCF